MIIKKEIQTSIDLFNSFDIYHPDKKKVVFDKLVERYKGICYQGCYILDIKEILRISLISAVSNRIDGGCSVNVKFVVSCIVLYPGELLCGVKILELHTNSITGSHDYAGVLIQRCDENALYKSLQRDQIVPVTVINSRYHPGQNKISVLSKPFNPTEITHNTYYQINEPLAESDLEKITELWDTIDALTVEVEKRDKKIIALFRELLYPYKNPVKFGAANKYFSAIDLKKLSEVRTGILVYPSEENKETGKAYISLEKEDKILEHRLETKNNDVYIHVSAYTAISKILNDYCGYLNSLLNLSACYSTVQHIKNLGTYWQICNNAKVKRST